MRGCAWLAPGPRLPRVHSRRCLPCLETAEAAPVPPASARRDDLGRVRRGHPAGVLLAAHGGFRQGAWPTRGRRWRWSMGRGERSRRTASAPPSTGSTRRRRRGSTSRRRSRWGASLVPLVALFAVGLLALLDCERQDWNAVSRRLHDARQMIEAGGLGRVLDDRRGRAGGRTARPSTAASSREAEMAMARSLVLYRRGQAPVETANALLHLARVHVSARVTMRWRATRSTKPRCSSARVPTLGRGSSDCSRRPAGVRTPTRVQPGRAGRERS